MAQITLKVEDLNCYALHGMATALLDDAGMIGRSRGIRIDRRRQVMAIILELETRAYGGDTSDLRECLAGLDACIERDRRGKAA